MKSPPASLRFLCFDWGGTLMSEDGPEDIAMGLWPQVSAIAGAAETLAALAPKFTLALATNATVSRRPMIERALERVSLRAYFAEIFCYTEIGAKKDQKRFWDVACQRLGAKPEEIAMVGDNLEQDVTGPAAFGIFTVWFNEEGRHAGKPRGAPVVKRLPELVKLFAGR